MALEEPKARLLAANTTTEKLLEQVKDLYVEEIQGDHEALNEALSELHNSAQIDLITAITSSGENSNGHYPSAILNAFENALPLLNAGVEDVLQCLAHLNQLDKYTYSGRFNEAFKKFCAVDIGRTRDGVQYILAQHELNSYASFLSSSILAYNTNHLSEAIKKTKNLLVNRNEIVRNQAYFTLGRLEVNESQADIIWTLLSDSISTEHENNCRASILQAALYFGDNFPSYWPKIEELLPTLFEKDAPEVLHEISITVAYQRINLPEEIFHILVEQLENISPEHKVIINNIDHLLVKLIDKKDSPIALNLLESILTRGVNISQLTYFSNTLVSKHKILLNHIVTKWFLSGEPSFCRGVFDLLNDATDRNIELAADITLLDNERRIQVRSA